MVVPSLMRALVVATDYQELLAARSWGCLSLLMGG